MTHWRKRDPKKLRSAGPELLEAITRAGYQTPEDWRLCKNFVTDGPTPCWHPHCDCFNEPKHWREYDEFMLLNAPPSPRKLVKIVVAALVLLVLLFSLRQAHGSEPFYCKPLERFERSCVGVRMAVASLGKDRAISIARKCGATDVEIAQAEECLRIPFTPPEKQ